MTFNRRASDGFKGQFLRASTGRTAGALLFLLILVLSVCSSSCHKRTPSTATPHPATPAPLKATPLSDYELAEESFDSGDYDAAARFYEAYLKTNNPREYQDRALYRLGLVYGLKSQGAQDLERSQAQFQRLMQQFPKSPYRAEAGVILSLQNEIVRLGNSLEDQQVEVEKLKEGLRDQQGEISKLKGGRKDQAQEIEKYRSDLKEQQAKVKALTEELERLKAIDLERRPSRPPQ